MSANMLVNIGSLAILTILWLGFGAALLFNPALLDSTWQAFRGLPMIAQIGLGLLCSCRLSRDYGSGRPPGRCGSV